MLRIRPDGTGLRVMAENFRNPYGGMPDSYGTLWMNDNDDDGNASTRVLWAMEGGSYGYYFSQDGSRYWGADRRAVAVFLRDVPLSKSEDLMVELARHYHPGDRFALEALGLAADGEEQAVYELLKSELDPAQPADWSRKWADLVWRLHPPGAVESLCQRTASPYVSWDEQKRAMVVALGSIDTREAIDAMTALADQQAQPRVAERARWWLDYRRTIGSPCS